MNIIKTLFEMSIFSSVMIVVVIAAKSIMNGKINLKIIAFLWSLVLIRLLVPVTISSPIHFDSLIKSDTSNDESTLEDAETAYNDITIPIIYNQPTVTYENTDDLSEYEPADTALPTASNQLTFTQKTIKLIKQMSILEYAIFVWGLGALFLIIRNAVTYCMFNIHIKQSKAVNDSRITSEILSLRKTLNIKSDVKVVISDYVDAPLTFRLINPIIVLPEHFVNMISSEKLNMVLLHELCHIKRKDIFINILWLAAKTIHWFNPLVWIAYNSYVEDIEIACDSMVTKYLTKEQSYVYSQSLVDVVRITKSMARLPIALSFCEGKCKIRKRVENMLKPTQKLKSAGAISIFLAVIMIVTCFTTACQPTPEEVIIQSKANSEMDEVIENGNTDNSQADAANQPETYQDMIQLLDGKLNINIDAAVYTQNNNWSIVQASTNSLSTDVVREMSSIIMNNQVLYNYTNEKTKQQLTDRYISYKSKWASGDRAISEEEYNQNCAGYESDIERAPETITYTMANYDTPTVYPDISGIPVEMYYFMNDPINSELEESIKFQSMEQGYEIFYQKILPEQDEYIETSQEQLISIAQSYLNELGIYNMTVVKIEENNPKFLTQEDIEFIGEENLTNEIFYRLYLTRDIGGNTVTYDLKDYANNNMSGPRPAGIDVPVYTPCPQGESVFMVITNNEVTNFKYTTPMTEHSVLSDNVSIKSIEEIMPIFTQYMEFNNAWTIASGESTVVDLSNMNILNSDMEVEKIEFNIDIIKLGYMRVKDKNSNINSYLFIPVWDFYGTTIIYYSDGTTSQIDRTQTSYLTINAIDGTVLNRYIGY